MPPKLSLSDKAASERGAALITMMLVGVLAAGLLSISWLESLDRERQLRRRDEYSLAIAKDALIGYSAAYPDTRRPGTKKKKGPGRLPCPDLKGDGSADAGKCRYPTTAYLPWTQLGVAPRSGVDENRIGYLWYAVDDKYRADKDQRTVNMETKPDSRVDDRDGVVAVIIDPGTPLDFQDPSRDKSAPEEFLEGENATPRDGEFTYGGVMASNPRRFNDRLALLTHDELMDVVALRVFAALRNYLRRYREAKWNEEGAPPWLLPKLNEGADDEGAKNMLATVGTRRGWLPIAIDGSEIETPFSLAGSLEGATIEGSVAADALNLLEQGLSVEKGKCTWISLGKADCEGSARMRLPSGGVRIYEIDIYLEGQAKVVAPSVSDLRRREVKGTKTIKANIEITEHGEEPATDENLKRKGKVRLTKDPAENDPVDKDEKAPLSVRGIAFPPSTIKEDPDDRRLPFWLSENDWHRLLWVEIAPPFVAGGSGNCMKGDCLSVTREFIDGRRRHEEGIAMVFLLPGRAIPPLRRDKERFDASQWFEGENANLSDGHYEMRLRTPDFNDYLDVSAPGFFRDGR
ncbi:hypothetical protein [Thioalkalivibrio sp. HK1]|uniref:hypothetical protein n=1 Tax=Thioalkalivibrio sp. HK1 TaxID=1469245 RepID=UPI0012DDF344|nr:hypothetical protein [Thioalkalivibrio sp. HK1]